MTGMDALKRNRESGMKREKAFRTNKPTAFRW
jgi:hypothetical protein